MDVGKEIRRFREEKGWSQAKLAGETGMGVSSVSQIETGIRNPSAVTLSKIAEALGVGIADLFPKAQSPLPLEYEPAEPQRARIGEAQDIDEAARIFEESIKERMEHPRALEAALEAAKRQAKQDAQAINRTLASEGIQQPPYFKDYENAAAAYLMQLDKGELASALLDMASMVVELKTRAARSAETDPEAATRSASSA